MHHPDNATSLTRPALRGQDLLATVIVTLLSAAPLGALLFGLGEWLGWWRQAVASGEATRLCVWLGLSLLLVSWEPARRVGPSLIARFDSACLQAPKADAGSSASNAERLQTDHPVTWQSLRDWCFAGAGNGRSPVLLPSVRPEMDQPLSAAVLNMGSAAALPILLQAFMCRLDGSHQLQAASGRWQRGALKLRVKRNDCLWWRTRQESDPWDCGHLKYDALAQSGLNDFLPRRPSLIVAQGLADAQLRQSWAVLRARQVLFAHPVRFLVVNPEVPWRWQEASEIVVKD